MFPTENTAKGRVTATAASPFSEEDLVMAHPHSSHNVEEVQRGPSAGCFHCLKIFASSEVAEWLADGTMLCPYCDIDSVLGSLSGYPLTRDFLLAMKKHWFRKISLQQGE